MGDRSYAFGPFVLDLNRRLLLKQGAPIKIGQRGLALLEALLTADGRAVSKSDLMDAAWQTENIEESNLTVQIAALRKSLGRAKNGEEWIATIQRSGYQFLDHDEGLTTPGKAERYPTLAMPQPSIAVLPFENMSSDTEQSYFADGLAEDLITDLSRVPGLLVIARHSSFFFREQKLNISQIAKELRVRYIVEGSVRRSAGRIRINAQLIDATTNVQIWAERFDRNLSEVFSIQDEVVGKIINALSTVLPLAQPPRKRRAPNLEAYDLFARGRILSMQSPNDNQAARPLLVRACELDPDFAEAQAWLAMNLLFGWMYCYQEDSRARVLELAPKAVALDPNNADAQVILGYVLIFNGDGNLAEGRARFEEALRLNPNHADAWLFLADLEVLEGHPEIAVETGKRAFQLNPHPPPYYQWLYSWMLYSARRYEDVVDMLGTVGPHAIGSQRNLAASLAQLGHIQDARDISLKFMDAVPQFTIKSWVNSLPFRNQSDKQHLIEGYLKAGFPFDIVTEKML
jgi:TolB-like protein